MVKRVVKDVPRAAADPIATAVAEGTSDDPFAVLGRHLTTLGGQPAVVIRTIQPFATSVDLVTPKGSLPMVRRDDGIYEVSVGLDGQAAHDFAYRLRVHEGDALRDLLDPYQFGPVLADFDLHLMSEGTHYRAWEKLGSHRITIGSVTGVHFAVWAPNAQRVGNDSGSWGTATTTPCACSVGRGGTAAANLRSQELMLATGMAAAVPRRVVRWNRNGNGTDLQRRKKLQRRDLQ